MLLGTESLSLPEAIHSMAIFEQLDYIVNEVSVGYLLECLICMQPKCNRYIDFVSLASQNIRRFVSKLLISSVFIFVV